MDETKDYIEYTEKTTPEYEREPLTNLEKILREKNLTQADLRRLIQRKSGFLMGRDRISKICTGRMIKYNIETAVMIAEALEVNVSDVIELKNVKKVNSYDLDKSE